MPVTEIDMIDYDNNNTTEKIPVLTEKNIGEVVLDFELSETVLGRAMEFYYTLKGEETLELINRLLSLYNVTMSTKIFNYLKAVCLLEKLPLIMKLYTSKEICGYKYDEGCFSILGQLCSVMKENNVCTTSRVEYITYLFKSKEQYSLAVSLFTDIIEDLNLENKYRFLLIKGLPSDELRYKYYLCFLRNLGNDDVYRILAGQSLVMKNIEMDAAQPLLVGIARDETRDYNTRADATDVLLRYGDASFKAIAKDIIDALGSVDGKPTTIYGNAQNAHTSSIEESAVEILSTLYNEPIHKTVNGASIDFEFVKADIIRRIGDNKIVPAVLNRISLDCAQYSKLHITLKTALVLVYSYILNRQEDNSLFANLISELTESHGICSTGIMERIANSLSGYEDFMLRISFEDQIKGNLHGRLNARIKNLSSIPCIHSKLCSCIEDSCYASKITVKDGKIRNDKKRVEKCGKCANCKGVDCIHECRDGCERSCEWNIDFQEKALGEMLVPSHKPAKRINFLRIYRLYISEIMEEMRKEFIEYIDLTSFDLYFRKAMMDYDRS